MSDDDENGEDANKKDTTTTQNILNLYDWISRDDMFFNVV